MYYPLIKRDKSCRTECSNEQSEFERIEAGQLYLKSVVNLNRKTRPFPASAT